MPFEAVEIYNQYIHGEISRRKFLFYQKWAPRNANEFLNEDQTHYEARNDNQFTY